MRSGQNGYIEKRTLTGKQITESISAAEGPAQILYALLAGTGMRVGEALALEVKDVCGTTITVREAKTLNGLRQVDVHSSLAALLRRHIGDRQSGFLFQNASGKPIWQIDMLRRRLHAILAAKGLEKRGFHAFRRFRLTHLVQNEDAAYRTDWAEKTGLGFQLPAENPIKKPVVGDAIEHINRLPTPGCGFPNPN